MKLRSNMILKVIVPTVVVISVVFIVMLVRSDNKKSQTQTVTHTVYDLTPDELRTLGIEGDTPQDTIRTLVGTIKKTRQDIADIRAKNDELRQKNELLISKNNDVDSRVAQALELEKRKLQQDFKEQTTMLLNEVETRLANLSNNLLVQSQTIDNTQTQSNSDLPIGLGSDTDTNTNEAGLRWIIPADMRTLDRNGNLILDENNNSGNGGLSFANVFNALDNSVVGKAHQELTGVKNNRQETPPTPIYTIPENSTLIGSVALTALLGRVPFDGVVNDPYPFKVIVGRENLTANGITLPNVEGAIFSGTASGDWTLSCVRGKVTSMTLVFSDGRISTLPDKSKNGGSDEGIGWISNPQGIPCIPGDRKTNAGEFLVTNFLLSGTSSAAQAFAQGQTTNAISENGNVISAVTGSQGKFLLGQALGGGLKESTEWFRKRYGQTFDAIYVPPGSPVVVNITQSLDINYDQNGRKVNYNSATQRSKLD
ncbi:integrating conjugative element protein [Mergibacter septicus]|uniref:Integrating conjugative element protein n=1 Tax=Mergibacter septicus TaxID=221402 RepID=A0A8D4LMS7_9PAST|nr:TIGR03752 family integrating conjugative element protein [Mergibacter septicus]AWX14718.1 integrating conjugative element protein [Mergibacter septicus]QDJ13969.1 integrating conjugative element protein [Mergibacter septicus]UTU48581.1 TIGR03752 family integrating conjugative element protein [Mergibacter septicus]WMR95789.1 TIGR03752 family integrating conjugative element protein [Mergibacter septicus]